MAGNQLIQKMKMFGLWDDNDSKLHQEILQDCINTFDQLSGKDTTDLITFEITIVVAFKEDK